MKKYTEQVLGESPREIAARIINQANQFIQLFKTEDEQKHYNKLLVNIVNGAKEAEDVKHLKQIEENIKFINENIKNLITNIYASSFNDDDKRRFFYDLINSITNKESSTDDIGSILRAIQTKIDGIQIHNQELKAARAARKKFKKELNELFPTLHQKTKDLFDDAIRKLVDPEKNYEPEVFNIFIKKVQHRDKLIKAWDSLGSQVSADDQVKFDSFIQNSPKEAKKLIANKNIWIQNPERQRIIAEWKKIEGKASPEEKTDFEKAINNHENPAEALSAANSCVERVKNRLALEVQPVPQPYYIGQHEAQVQAQVQAQVDAQVQAQALAQQAQAKVEGQLAIANLVSGTNERYLKYSQKSSLVSLFSGKKQVKLEEIDVIKQHVTMLHDKFNGRSDNKMPIKQHLDSIEAQIKIYEKATANSWFRLFSCFNSSKPSNNILGWRTKNEDAYIANAKAQVEILRKTLGQ